MWEKGHYVPFVYSKLRTVNAKLECFQTCVICTSHAWHGVCVRESIMFWALASILIFTTLKLFEVIPASCEPLMMESSLKVKFLTSHLYSIIFVSLGKTCSFECQFLSSNLTYVWILVIYVEDLTMYGIWSMPEKKKLKLFTKTPWDHYCYYLS